MAGNNAHAGDEPRNPHVRYEPGDVNAILLTKFGLGLTFLLIVFLFGLWGLFEYLVREASGGTAPAQVTARKLPPEPRLQAEPARDMRQFRASEEQAMRRYGWVDPDKGIVRIPVDRAMDIVAQKGLPALPRSSAPAGEKKP